MERSSSRFLVPLAVAASLMSADNAKAMEGDANGPLVPMHAQSQSAPSPDPVAFCEELRTATDSDSDIQEFVEFFGISHSNHISMQILKEIHAVLEDGGEVVLGCSYPSDKDNLYGSMKTPTQDFAKNLFEPKERASSITVETPTATYTDYYPDGMPDRVNFHGQGTNWTYDDATRNFWDTKSQPEPSQCHSDPYEGTECIDKDTCFSDTAVCEALGVGLGDFDAAIQAGRKALGVLPTFVSPGTESTF